MKFIALALFLILVTCGCSVKMRKVLRIRQEIEIGGDEAPEPIPVYWTTPPTQCR